MIVFDKVTMIYALSKFEDIGDVPGFILCIYHLIRFLCTGKLEYRAIASILQSSRLELLNLKFRHIRFLLLTILTLTLTRTFSVRVSKHAYEL